VESAATVTIATQRKINGMKRNRNIPLHDAHQRSGKAAEPKQNRAKVLLRGMLLVLALLVCGCAAGGMSFDAEQTGPAPDRARLTIYLETRGDCAAELGLTLKDFVLHQDHEEIPLFLEPVSLRRSQVQGRQQLLGLVEVPTGYYGRFEVTVSTQKGEDQVLSLPLSKDILLDEGDSQCLFVTWQLDGCVDSAGQFVPRFSAKGQEPPLAADLLYALSSTIQTLYLVRTDTQFVVASIGLDGQAVDMGVDAEDQRLYLLSRSGRSLQVFDLANHQLVDLLPLPLTMKPEHLALDVKNNIAFVSDPLSRRVVKINLDTGQMVAHRQVGLQPSQLEYFAQESGGLVAVCTPTTQNVVLLSAETLASQRTIDTGLQPGSLVYLNGYLLVAEVGSQTVTAFDVASGQNVGQVRLMGQPGEMLANSETGKVYVGNAKTSRLDVLSVGQFTVLRNLAVGGKPGALAMSARRGIIYVGSPETGRIAVVDRTSERVTGAVALGGSVTDLVVNE